MYEEEFENDYDDETEFYAIRPNKSQIKREMAELSDFAKELVQLSPTQLNLLELDETLHKAIILGATTSKGAHKRQLKYIVGLFRKIDLAPIQEKFARMQSKSAHAVREHHITERWRDSLISGNDDVLTELLDEYPEIDRQFIRQLIRNAKKEALETLPPKSTRLLYQYLKQIISHEITE